MAKKTVSDAARAWLHGGRNTIRISRAHPGAGYAIKTDAETRAEKADNAKAAEAMVNEGSSAVPAVARGAK